MGEVGPGPVPATKEGLECWASRALGVRFPLSPLQWETGRGGGVQGTREDVSPILILHKMYVGVGVEAVKW